MSYEVDVSTKPHTNGNPIHETKANDRLTCKLNSSQSTYLAKQGYPYHSGISVHTAGSKAIAMHTVTIPPGAREKAHLHRDHETAVYLISGEIKLWFGENLEESFLMRAGDFLYIPQNVPHLPINPSSTEPGVVVISRTDPNEQASVVLLPHLDKLQRS